MGIQEAVVNRIKVLSNEHHMSLYALSSASGIPLSTIKNILNGRSLNTGIVTIAKLCDGFNISIIQFFDTEEFRNLEQELI